MQSLHLAEVPCPDVAHEIPHQGALFCCQQGQPLVACSLVLHTDDFASPTNPINWWPRLVSEVLEPLSRNQPARYHRTDWGNPDHQQWGEVIPAEFVILEGVTASREAFQPFLTYSVWIETPRELRLARGLKRDGEEARAHWEEWMAGEDNYAKREKPRERADLVLPGDQILWS